MSDSSNGLRHAARRGAALAFAWLTVVAAAHAQPAPMGSAESFAVLARSSIANTGASTIRGDAGVGLGGAVTGFPPGTVDAESGIHTGDAVALQALLSAGDAFDAIAELTCPAANNLTGQDLGGRSLAPGVYCFRGNAPLSGTLTLTGAGPWTFQVGGQLTVADNAQVLAPAVTSTCKGSLVQWQVAGNSATIGATASVIGSVVSRTDVSVGAGASVDGRAIALEGTVTLQNNRVAACSAGSTFPPHQAIKVTGGGQLSVPDPDSSDHRRTGRGRATFAFNAIPGSATTETRGRFLYLNHANRSHSLTFGRMHISGRVRNIDVVALKADGSPKTVRFDGTCSRPDCTFSVLVEDNGEGRRDDDDDADDDDDVQRGADHNSPPRPRDNFGVVIVANGRVVESRDLRPIARGNIQFHPPPTPALTSDVNDVEFGPGDVMDLSVSLDPGPTSTRADAYIVLEMPNGQLLSWTGTGLVPGLVPIARGFVPVPYSGVVARVVIPRGAPAGRYTWLSALTVSGTLSLMTPISETVFTITP